MVRAVVGDETQVEAYADSLFVARTQVQVGLLIGKLEVSSSRDSVFALVPTPAKDGEEAAKITGGQKESSTSSGKKSNAKAKSTGDNNSSLVIDTDWIAEHSRQVSRMLVGGMDVVGIFVFASETALKNSTAVLWQAVRAVSLASPLEGESDERLVLQISSSPRRISCKSCVPHVSYSATALRPCDWKLGKLLPNLHSFVCSHPVEIRLLLLVDKTGASAGTVKDNLIAAISAESARLKSAVAVVDMEVPSPDQVLGPVKTLGTSQVVDYLIPLDGSGGTGDIEGRQDVQAMVTLTGVVHARAYASAREPLQRAIMDLKRDVISSLRSRLDLLCDEVERAAEDAESSGNKELEDSSAIESNSLFQLSRPSDDVDAECSLALPRRVFIPWHGEIFLCDYLLNDETLETDVRERCEELFAYRENFDASRILQPELSAVVPSTTSFEDEVSPDSKRNSSSEDLVVLKDSGKQDSPPHSLVLTGAIIVLLIAMLLALFMLK